MSIATSRQTAHAENVFTIGFAKASAGARDVPILVTAMHDVAIHGYSLAFSFPTPALRLNDIRVAGTHIGQVEPEFVSPTIDNRLGIGSLGVIFDFVPPVVLSELPPMEEEANPIVVALLSFDVNGAGGVYDIELRDGIGSPPAFNRLTNAGTSIVPELEGGSIMVTGGDVLQLDKQIAIPGTQSRQVFARASHADPLDGFQIAFTYNKNALLLRSSSFDSTDVLREFGPEGVESFIFQEDPHFSLTESRVTSAALFDATTPLGQKLLPASVLSPPLQTLVRYTFDIRPGAATLRQFQDLTLENVNVAFAIDNRFFVDAQGVDPQLVSGKFYFSTGGMSGRLVNSDTGNPVSGAAVITDPDGYRATTSGSGVFTIDNIPPGVYALEVSRSGYYDRRVRRVLVNGSGVVEDLGSLILYPILESPVQPFLRGDCDGDGVINAITDSIVLLDFNFKGGPRPPCFAACDVDGDGSFVGTITDAIYLLGFSFQGGPAPLPPYPACGDSMLPSDTRVGCERRAQGCQ